MDQSTDKSLKCRDCGAAFIYSAKDQQFYAERNFCEPRRCKSCRQRNKENRAAREAHGKSNRSGDSRESGE